MSNIEVILINAFTLNGKGGNKAGVVLNADKLSKAQKLKIAQTVAYSETAFVSKDDKADYHVSFFTSTGEVDFCGHATLAVFWALYDMGTLSSGTYVQNTKAGMLSVSIKSDGKVIMDQALPKKFDSFTYEDISSLLGIENKVLKSTNLPIEIISTGLKDVIIPVPQGYLDLIVPKYEEIAAFCKKHSVVGFHIFELCSKESKYTASCRNFAPLFGIKEEAATGSSSGALASYLWQHLDLGDDYIFEQGRAMNCSSLITASIRSKNSTIINVKVGGYASKIATRVITF